MVHSTRKRNQKKKEQAAQARRAKSSRPRTHNYVQNDDSVVLLNRRRGLVRGAMNGITRLPLEVLEMIFVHLAPRDLLRLARCNKFFKSVVAPDANSNFNANRIWEAARANFNHLPPPPPGMSEFVYAQYFFESTCMFCSKKASWCDLTIRLRACRKHCNTYAWPWEPPVTSGQGFPYMKIREIIPNTCTPQGKQVFNRLEARKLLAEFQRVEKRVDIVDPLDTNFDFQKRQNNWKRVKMNKFAERRNHSRSIVRFKMTMNQQNRANDSSYKKVRLRGIYERLMRAGHSWEDFQVNPKLYDQTTLGAQYYQRTELNDEHWNKIKVKIETIVVARRSQRGQQPEIYDKLLSYEDVFAETAIGPNPYLALGPHASPATLNRLLSTPIVNHSALPGDNSEEVAMDIEDEDGDRTAQQGADMQQTMEEERRHFSNEVHQQMSQEFNFNDGESVGADTIDADEYAAEMEAVNAASAQMTDEEVEEHMAVEASLGMATTSAYGHVADGAGEGGSGGWVAHSYVPNPHPTIIRAADPRASSESETDGKIRDYSELSGKGLKGQGTKFGDLPGWGTEVVSSPNGTLRITPLTSPEARTDLLPKEGKSWVRVGRRNPQEGDWNHNGTSIPSAATASTSAPSAQEGATSTSAGGSALGLTTQPKPATNGLPQRPQDSQYSQYPLHPQYSQYPQHPQNSHRPWAYPWPNQQPASNAALNFPNGFNNLPNQNPSIYSLSVQYNPQTLQTIPNESWPGWGRGPRAVASASPAPAESGPEENAMAISRSPSPASVAVGDVNRPPSALEEPRPGPPSDVSAPSEGFRPASRSDVIQSERADSSRDRDMLYPGRTRNGNEVDAIQREIRTLPQRARRGTPRGSATPVSRSSPAPPPSEGSGPSVGASGLGPGASRTASADGDDGITPSNSNSSGGSGGDGGAGAGSWGGAAPPAAATAERQCENCKVTVSPNWRTGPNNQMFCNACGLYWKNHKELRPQGGFPGVTRSPRSRGPTRPGTPVQKGKAKVTKEKEKEKEKEKDAEPATVTTAAAPAAGTSTSAAGNASNSKDDKKQPRSCENCGATSSATFRRGFKNQLLCNACGLYERNHGEDRPPFLTAPYTGPKRAKQQLQREKDNTIMAPIAIGGPIRPYGSIHIPQPISAIPTYQRTVYDRQISIPTYVPRRDLDPPTKRSSPRPAAPVEPPRPAEPERVVQPPLTLAVSASRGAQLDSSLLSATSVSSFLIPVVDPSGMEPYNDADVEMVDGAAMAPDGDVANFENWEFVNQPQYEEDEEDDGDRAPFAHKTR